MENNRSAGVSLVHCVKHVKDARIVQVGADLILQVIHNQRGMTAMIANHAQHAELHVALTPALCLSLIAGCIEGRLRGHRAVHKDALTIVLK